MRARARWLDHVESDVDRTHRASARRDRRRRRRRPRSRPGPPRSGRDAGERHRHRAGARVHAASAGPRTALHAAGRPSQLDLERFMSEHGGRFRRTAVLGVDAEQRTLSCTTGPDERYDTLVIAVGASARPAYEHALTFGADFLACDELLADLAHGGPHSVAFVVPEGCTWPLPLYELALMTADEARLTNADEIRVHLVTPERSGARPLRRTRERRRHRVAAGSARRACIAASTRTSIAAGTSGIGPEGTLAVDRVVALAHLDGPRLAGLPADAHGFIPVDEYGRVTGVDAVYAAGDATDHPIKHGGLASPAGRRGRCPCRSRRRRAGRGRPLRPGAPRAAAHPGFARHDPALWWPPAKVSGRYLAPYLEAHGLVAPSAAPERTGRRNRRPAATELVRAVRRTPRVAAGSPGCGRIAGPAG